MTGQLRSWWVPVVALLFVVVNTALMVRGFPWLNLLPVALLLGWALLTRPDDVLLFVVLVTPLSINLEQLEVGGIGVALPTEPLMVALMGIYLFRLILDRTDVDGRFFRHPVTWLVFAQLAWTAICIAPSTMPLVSVKFLAARLWFVCTMYFMMGRLFRDERMIPRFFWCFIAGLSVAVVYTLVRHAQYGFEHDPAHWVMEPLFKDHTSYGAVLAMVLPFLFLAPGMPQRSWSFRVVVAGLFALLAVGLVFSFTRAAWVSLVAAAGVYVVMRLRIPAWLLTVLALTAGGLYLLNQEAITRMLEKNEQESSDDLAEHVSSISNVSSDASNLERINRWNSALRMFEEKPVFGWGPGTYMFQYAPFQASRDLTIISTNFGDVGNAHSEYLGPLAEQGLVGALLVLALFITVTVTAVRLWSRLPPGADRGLVAAAFLGLLTYYVHGVLNNYLDLDKASVPFWAMTAMIVVLDIKHTPGAGQTGPANRQVSSAISSK